jgi:predicted peroxiredoxin
MSKRYFVKIVTDPEIDPRKCVVGMACAAQALDDGYEVNMFFASHAVRLLQKEYLSEIDERSGVNPGMGRSILDRIIQGGAGIFCSTGSQAVVGVTKENADGVLVPGMGMVWSDPKGVISLSADSDVQLVY